MTTLDFLGSRALQVTISGGSFHTEHKGRLDVGAACDHESLKRRRVEELEPQRGRHGSDHDDGPATEGAEGSERCDQCSAGGLSGSADCRRGLAG